MMELVKAGPVGPDTLRFQIHDLASPCDQWCRFCPRSLDPSRGPPAGPDLQALVRARFTAMLAEHGHRDVVLLSADILAWPDLFSLLTLARDHGRRVTLLTPGGRLADPAFADRFVGWPVRFDLTWLSDDPATVTAITRVPGGHARLLQAITHLRQRHLPFRLSTVLNTDNIAQLPDIVASACRLGARHLTVRMFYPDYDRPRPSYYDQFPSFDALQSALDALARLRLDPNPTVELTNTPWCQVDLPQAGPRVFMRPGKRPHNTHATDGLPECASCPQREGCVRVHPRYLERHTARPVTLERIDANVSASAAILGAARQEGTGVVGTEGWIAG